MDFYKNFERYENNLAFISENSQKYFYSDLISFRNEILKKIENRNLIFHLTSNCYDSIAGYLSFLNTNNVPLLVDISIEKEFLSNLLDNYKPKFIYIPKSKIDLIEEKNIIYENSKYYLIQTSYKIDYKLKKELGLLLSTSGSTGIPKFVKLTYDNINSNATSIAQYLNIKKEHKAISSMPTNYSFMLSIINSHILKGSSIILTEYTVFDKAFWKLLNEEKATTLSGVPYTFEMLKKLRFENIDLPYIKYITQAGGKLKDDLVNYYAKSSKEKNIKFIIMYGQTEASARMSYLPWEKLEDKIGSIGIAIPMGKFHIEDENGKEIEQSNIEGELVYTGPNVGLGYALNCYDLNKEDENKGSLKTGDIAKKDDDGFFYITGRKKRFLKLFGNRINIDHIEQILQKNGYSCTCVGIDDKLSIFSTEKYNSKQIIETISKLIKIHKTGFEYFHVTHIPRSESGKIRYQELYELKGTK